MQQQRERKREREREREIDSSNKREKNKFLECQFTQRKSLGRTDIVEIHSGGERHVNFGPGSDLRTPAPKDGGSSPRMWEQLTLNHGKRGRVCSYVGWKFLRHCLP
jgi:hypothetical protein